MNQKAAKRLRRVARIAMRDASLRDSEYERHAVRGNWRVALTSARSLYRSLKKGTT